MKHRFVSGEQDTRTICEGPDDEVSGRPTNCTEQGDAECTCKAYYIDRCRNATRTTCTCTTIEDCELEEFVPQALLAVVVVAVLGACNRLMTCCLP